jgi:malonate decarboxylase gamma subunit
MIWQDLAQHLFGDQHGIHQEGQLLRGEACLQPEGEPIAVVGTTGHAPIGVRLALAQAREVLDVVAQHAGRTILLLIDTQGQQLRRQDELLGINRAMAHLACCIDLARRRGHRVIGLVYDQALSGGFITTGLMADACHALPQAEIRVMNIPAMSRITKLPVELLERLSESNPVFAPGVGNYHRMGGVRELWEGELRDALSRAIAQAPRSDERAADGAARGGRLCAQAVIERVLAA